MFDDGAKLIRVAGGPISFYENYQCTTLYVERVFGGGANSLTISNDSATDIITLSYDGATVEAELNAGESITLNVAARNSIYIKGDTGGDYARAWCW